MTSPTDNGIEIENGTYSITLTNVSKPTKDGYVHIGCNVKVETATRKLEGKYRDHSLTVTTTDFDMEIHSDLYSIMYDLTEGAE